MAKRKFTAEDKLKIVKEASEQGVTKTLTKYDVYPATYYSWRRKLKEQGEDAFSHGVTAKQLKELRHLEKENRQLKELVAEKELLIRALKESRSKKS